MNKPLSLKIKELRSVINQAIGYAELPPTIIEMVISDIYKEILNIVKECSEKEEKEYYEFLQKEKSSKEEQSELDIVDIDDNKEE